MKALKIAGAVLAAVVVLLVVAGAVLVTFIDAAARRGVSEGTEYALQVPTSLDSADVRLLAGEFAMAGLTVANPEGYQTPHFLTLDDAFVAADLSTLRKQTVELPTLTLADIDLYLERREGKANYKVILDNLKRFESGESTEPDAKKSAKRLVIREVRVENVHAHVRLLPVGGELTEAEVVVPEIVLRNVGKEGGGASVGELADIILKAIFASVLATGENVLPDDVFQDLQGGLDQLAGLAESGVSLGVDLGEGVTDITGDVLEGAGEQAGQALEGLGQTIQDIAGDKKDDDDGG